jgi:hypothetical protein
MSTSPRNPPKAVIRGKELADLIRGRNLLFKARNYMGPVHVDEASCNYRWFRLKMTTLPWQATATPRVLEWEVPPSGVTETGTKITVRAYDTVGMLVHDPNRIEEIEALHASGASVNELLRAFNSGRWGLDGARRLLGRREGQQMNPRT